MRIQPGNPTESQTEHTNPTYWVTLWEEELPGQWFSLTLRITDAQDVDEVLDYVDTAKVGGHLVSVETPGNPRGRIVLAGADPTPAGAQIRI